MGTYEHKEKNNVLIYHDIVPSLELIRDQPNGFSLIGKLFLSVMYYSRDSKMPNFSNDEALIQLLFNQMKVGIDTNRKKYDEVCERNKGNRNKGNSKNPDNLQIIDAETGEVIESDSDTLVDSNVPTLEMVLQYFLIQKQHPLTRKQGEQFIDYYIECSKTTDKPWKEIADSWFNNLSAV